MFFVFVDDRAERSDRFVGLAALGLETREIDAQRRAIFCARRAIDQRLEQFDELVALAGRRVELTQLGRGNGIFAVVFEEHLVELDRPFFGIERLGVERCRAMLERRNLGAVVREIGAPQEELHDFVMVGRGLAKLRELLERPAIAVVDREQIAKHGLGQRRIGNEILRDLFRFVEQIAFRLELGLERCACTKRRDEIALTTGRATQIFDIAQNRYIFRLRVERLQKRIFAAA